MAEQKKHYWFKRRRYGYGWFPASREGWLAVGAYLLTVLISSYVLLRDVPDDTYQAEVGYFFGIVFMSTLCLIMVSRAKGPTAQWRWGVTEDDNPEEDL